MNKSPISNKKPAPLGPETVRSLQELGELLRTINNRLLSEGYVFKNGKFIKPECNETNNRDSC
jgi:hypothetical protein